MVRPRRQHPHLVTARRYIEEHLPELKDAPLTIRMLDGPPGSARYAVTVEQCQPGECPHGIDADLRLTGQCTIEQCTMRHTTRILLDQHGVVMQISQNDRHWR